MKRANSSTNNESSSRKARSRKTERMKSHKTAHHVVDIEKPRPRKISELCQSIGGLYRVQETDVNFVFNNGDNEQLIPVHKCVLASHSPVFRQMFYESEIKERGDVKLPDTTIDAFVNFMGSLYTRMFIKGTKKNISPLLYLVHKYDVNWLENECKEILNAITDNDAIDVLWVLPLINLYGYDELKSHQFKKIREHGNVLINSGEFVDCERDVVNQILSIDFKKRNEVMVFERCIRWAKRSCEKAKLDPESSENIKAQLGDCFELIKFGSMTATQFVQCLSINSKIFTNDDRLQRISSEICGTKPRHDTLKSNLRIEKVSFAIGISSDSQRKLVRSLFDDKSTSDVTFIFKNQQNEEIGRQSAHKMVLAEKSAVFGNLFNNSNILNVEINNAQLSVKSFKDFLQLMYSYVSYISPCELYRYYNIVAMKPDSNADAILWLANLYKVADIKIFFEYYLERNLNEQNVTWCLDLSQKHSLRSLKSRCVEFLKEKGEQTMTSETFLDIDQPTLKAILHLRIWKNEKTLVNTCIEWAKKYCAKYQLDSANPTDVRRALGDAFELIPFCAMEPMDFIRLQGNFGAMFTDSEIRKIYDEFAERSKQNST